MAGYPGGHAVAGNVGGDGSRSLVVLCLEASESLVEPICSTKELQQELVPYVLSHSLQSSKFMKLSKEERKLRVKALTQKMLSGEYATPGGDTAAEGEDEGDISPQRFWLHMRTKYGTRRGQLIQALRHLEPQLRGHRVVVLRFEGEISLPSASLLVRASSSSASSACSVPAASGASTARAETADASRLEFAEGDYSANRVDEWFMDSHEHSVCRAPPLWARLADECRRDRPRTATTPDSAPGGQPFVLLLCTEMRSTDTAPETVTIAGHLLHRDCELVPFLSGLTFGPQSSERLQALEELCAWSGGLSFNIDELSMLTPAMDAVLAHVFADAGAGAAHLMERRNYHWMKQKLGTCFLHLPPLAGDAAGMAVQVGAGNVEPVTPAGKRSVSLKVFLGSVAARAKLDSAVPSQRMLDVLSDTTLAILRRWSRSLRVWRERRGLRDVVFAEPGGLGLELNEPELDQSDLAQRVWNLRATHPPASALKMDANSVLVGINHARVHSQTPRSEVSRRSAQRPVSLTFRNPGGFVEPLQTGALVSAVVAEVAVAELREGYPPLKHGAAPLSLMVNRVKLAATAKGPATAPVSARMHQTARVLRGVCCWGPSTDSGSSALPRWLEHASASTPTGGASGSRTRTANDLFSKEPAVLYRVMLFCGEITALSRGAKASSSWQWLLQHGARPASSEENAVGAGGASVKAAPQRRLWQWVLRWGCGPPPARRLDFWRWALGLPSGPGVTELVDATAVVLAAGLQVDATGLLRLASGLAGASPGAVLAVAAAAKVAATLEEAAAAPSAAPLLPADVLEALFREPFYAQRMWMLTTTALPWLAQQGRAIQVIFAAHCPQLFKHFVGEGLAPELFYISWLQSMFHSTVHGAALVRIWDLFVWERSHKIFFRTFVALFALLEQKLRCDVEQMMKVLFDIESVRLDPEALITRALETKVTRSMLQEVEACDAA